VACSSPRCRYAATPTGRGDTVNLRFTVLPGEEAHAGDIGVTEILNISRADAEVEFAAMQSLGYEMVSELREALACFGL
jgi:hypothetical protein